ncbi:hypothetical protein Tco_0711757 [Tanacetum coccineum]
MFGPFQGNDIVFIWADLGFSATRECDLRVEDGPRVEHPKGETRLTHGVSLLVMSSSLSAPWTPACVGIMFVTRPSSQMRHIRVSASSGKMLLGQSSVERKPITLGEAFALARITEAHFEDERATTIISKPNDLNIAVQVQDIEETTLHTSDKVEALSTNMVTTYEEHGCQDGFCMVATYEEQGCQDGLKPVTTKSPTGKKGDLGAITSKGGPPDHMRASEKELAVLKSPLEQKSMFRRQERMLRRQEQQRLAKDAKIQRRIWDPGIKSLQDNTLRARWF